MSKTLRFRTPRTILEELIRQLGPAIGVMLWVMCCPKGQIRLENKI